MASVSYRSQWVNYSSWWICVISFPIASLALGQSYCCPNARQWKWAVQKNTRHYSDVIMRAMASHITGISIVCLTGRSKKTWKIRVTGLCEGNPSVTGGFPPQRASNVENVSILWRHHEHNTQTACTHWNGDDFIFIKISSLAALASVKIKTANAANFVSEGPPKIDIVLVLT